MKKFLSLLIALVLIISTLSLSAIVAFAEEDTPIDATGIKLDSTSKIIYKDKSFEKETDGTLKDLEFNIKATLTPDGAKGEVKFDFKDENNESIKNGLISLVKPEAKDGEEQPENEITVVVKPTVAAEKYIIVATLVKATDGDAEDEDEKVISEEFTLNIRNDIEVDDAKLLAIMKAHENSKINLEREFAMSDQFMLNNDWMKVETGEGENKVVSAQNVRDVFKGINYYIDGEKNEEGEDLYSKDEKYDVVSVEYLTPSGDPKVESDWKNVALSSTFSMRTEGWWQFRYIVKDSEGTVIARTAAMERNAIDTRGPVIKLSTSLESKQKEGIKALESYTVSTYLDITDDRSPSDTTTTYVIEKKIDGNWVEVYNSVDKVIKDEYKEFILEGGTIKPLESDIIEAENDADRYIYRVVYSVKDGAGHFGVAAAGDKTEAHPTLSLFVTPADADEDNNNAIAAWKIVLYVIAGLSAVGIIVLLCIKPKQEVVDGRVAPAKMEEKEVAEETVEAEEATESDENK